MFRLRRKCLVLGAIFFTGCTGVPSLQQTTGSADAPVFVTDVVKRVKCEIRGAFADKYQGSSYLWIRNWTAKADLTLTLNESAGLSPSVQTTSVFKNTANSAAGASSFSLVRGVLTPGTGIGVLSNTLTWGAGANYNESAQRTEAISFSLAVKDLVERNAECPEQKGPDLAEGLGLGESGLVAGLGLKEWVDAVVRPVVLHELEAGDHPAPGSPSSVGAPSSKAATPKAAGIGKYCRALGDKVQDITKSKIDTNRSPQDQLTDIFRTANEEVNRFADIASTVETKAKTLSDAVDSRHKALMLNDDQSTPYQNVLNENYKKALQIDKKILSLIARDVHANYSRAIQYKVSSDNIKTLVGKIYKDPILGVKDINYVKGILVAEEVICPNPGDRLAKGDVGKGCGVLDCKTRYKDIGGVPDSLKLIDTDFNACKALDNDYKAKRTITNASRKENGLASLPELEDKDHPNPIYYLQSLELLDDSRCANADIKASTECQDRTARTDLENSCHAVLDFLIRIRGYTDDGGKKVEGDASKVSTIVDNINILDVSLQRLPAPALPDPPIDSISHQVQFIVTYGANVSPNWSLAAFKGPGAAGNLASTNGTRTHLLTISLGPRNGNQKVSPEQDRSIQNLNILSLAQPH